MNSVFTCTAAATFLALAFACFAASLSTPVDVRKDSVKLEELNPRLTFWADRWSSQTISWHKESVHPMLLKYFDVAVDSTSHVGGSNGKNLKVLVPLCGKTVDMKFLAEASVTSHVYGVDGVSQALETFSKQNPSLEISSDFVAGYFGTYERMEGDGISLLHGDFFALEPREIGNEKIDVVWDRASMVAIRPELREDYVETMRRMVRPGGVILLVTLERREGTEDAKVRGPPFSISEQTVRSFYGGRSWVESIVKLDEVNDFIVNPGSKQRWLSQGLTGMYELCFIIKIKEDSDERV